MITKEMKAMSLQAEQLGLEMAGLLMESALPEAGLALAVAVGVVLSRQIHPDDREKFVRLVVRTAKDIVREHERLEARP